jgi:hypothetical protein
MRARAFGIFVLGCAGCYPPPPPCVAQGAQTKTFVLTSMQAPTNNRDFAADLNGDVRVDNAMGRALSALIQQGVDPQEYIDLAFAAGVFRPTLELTSTDVAGGNAEGARAVFSDGGDSGVFCGDVLEWAYDSSARYANSGVTLSMRLPFFNNVRVPLVGAQLRYVLNGNSVSGQLNAAATNETVRLFIIPSIAALMQQKIDGDPQSSLAQNLLLYFDNGGVPAEVCHGACRNSDGTCGIRGNKRIEVCEVKTNSITHSLLDPDVQLFRDGAFDPQCANTARDSWSMGVGFTAMQVP